VLAVLKYILRNYLGEVLKEGVNLVNSQLYISKSNLQYLCETGLDLVSHSFDGTRVSSGFKTCAGAALMGSRSSAGKLAKSFGTASIASVAKAIAAIVWGRWGDAHRTEQTRCSTNGSLGAVRDWQRSGAKRPDKVTPFARHALSREGEHGSGEQHACEVQGWSIW